MKKFLLYTLLLTCLAFSTIVAMPLSPESVSNLRASGHLEEVLERQNRAHALGIDAPGSNVLEGIRQLHRDNPDEVTLRVLIILVDFEDNEANNDEFPAEHFEQLLFSVDEFEPGSMREWYLENTYDEVDLIGDVIGWVRLPETYAYYVNRNNGNGGWPQNSQRMTYDAVQLIEDEVDFSIYDNDDNGSVDGIFVVHAGPGAEQNDGNRDMIWSHAWGLNNHRLQYDGVWIDRYSTEPEDGQIGVFGHEAAHALFGIPDLYDRGYQSSGLGAWSMMAGGSWGDGGRSPAHFDAWSKLQMGVTDPQNVNENLYNIEIPAIESEDASYIIWQDGDPGNEYFLIENRQQIGFDTSIPGAGLIIYHIDDAARQTQNDREWFPGNEDNGHYLVALEQADGNWDLEQDENRGDEGDPFPGSTDNQTFDAGSTPSSRAYSGESTDVSILDIEQNDGVITCSLIMQPAEPDIRIQPLEIESINSSENIITVSNTGEGLLEWSSAFDVISQPGRDKSKRQIREVSPNSENPSLDPAGGPDGMGYTWVDNAEDDGPDFEWIDISEIGTQLDAGDDWLSPWQDIGFVFPWYTEEYEQVRVCSNGWVTFQDYGNGRYNWPDEPGPVAALFVNTFDIDPREIGAVYIWTNEEDTFIVSWVDVPRYGNADHRTTFQCILINDGTVAYQYGPQEGINGAEQNVGFESPNGERGASIISEEANRIDDGLAISIGSPWTSLTRWEPKNGTIRADEETDITLTIATDEFESGDYEAELHILSNDPEEPDISINILISIDRLPAITFDPEILDFGEVHIDNQSDLILTLGNAGESVLEISEMSIGADGFNVEFGENISVAPGDESEISISFTPVDVGDYNGTLTITSNDPNDPLEIPLTGIGVPLELQYFSNFNTTDVNHSVLVLSLEHNGEPVPTGWEIGLFTPDNLLAGAGVWRDGGRLGISAWGDDAQTQIIDGFRDNELIAFRVWDNEADIEYYVDTELIDGNLSWSTNGFAAINLIALPTREMTVAFGEGWNIISINVLPSNEYYAEGEDRGPDIELMVEQLRIDEDNHHVILLKNGDGQFYSPAFGFSNIEYWSLTEGYQINIDEDVEAVFVGLPIDFDTDIPLTEGWNIAAYFPEYDLDASSPEFYVLSSILDNVISAKDNHGLFMLPAFNFSNMNLWRESQGYMIKVDQDVILNYPVENNGNNANPDDNNEHRHWAAPVRTSQNMSLLISSISGIDIPQACEVASIDDNGHIVGRGRFLENGSCGLAVWGDDTETDLIEGLKNGDAFSLKIWDETTDIEQSLIVEYFETGSELRYQKDGIIVLNASVESFVPSELFLSQCYPNPFNATTRLTFGLPEASQVSLGIYDLSGRLVTSLVNGNYNAGTHSALWESGNASTGVYLVRMEAGEFSSIRKVTLLR